jgi:hypothetical protein
MTTLQLMKEIEPHNQNRLPSTATREQKQDAQDKDHVNTITKIVLYLRSQFALSIAFASVAQNMRVLDEGEAQFINSLLDKSALVLNGFSVMTIGLGGILALTGQNSQLAIVASAVSVGATAIAGLKQTLDKKKGFAQALEYAAKKAEALAVHAQLSVELSSLAGGLKLVFDELDKVHKLPTTNHSEVVALANAFLPALKGIDGFYDTTLAKAQAAIQDRANTKFFTPETQNRLTELVKQIIEARSTWADLRPVITVSEAQVRRYLEEGTRSN